MAASLCSSLQAEKIIGLEKKVAGTQQFRNYIPACADFPKLKRVRDGSLGLESWKPPNSYFGRKYGSVTILLLNQQLAHRLLDRTKVSLANRVIKFAFAFVKFSSRMDVPDHSMLIHNEAD